MNHVKMMRMGVLCGGLLAGLVFAPSARADFKAKFDQANTAFNGGWGNTDIDNTEGGLAWGESYVMMGYMEMYRATKDTAYLKKLVAHAEKVIAHRDDMLDASHRHPDYLNRVERVWSANSDYTPGDVWVPFVVHSGMITYPMVDFARTVKADVSLQNILSDSGATLLNRANWLVDRVKETVADHDDEWDAAAGAYISISGSPDLMTDGAPMPLNMQAAMARTLTALVDIAPNPSYQAKAVAIAAYIKSKMVPKPDGTYYWTYSGGGTNVEDVSHGSVETGFAVMAKAHGWSFTDSDLTRYAANFTQRINIDVRQFMSEIDGSGSLNNIGKLVNIGPWATFADQDRDVYQPLADLMLDYDFQGEMGAPMLGYAWMRRQRQVLEPIGAFRGFADNAAFAGVAAGNLDGVTGDEIVWVRNSDGNIGVAKLGNAVGGVAPWTGVTKYTGYPTTSNWAGVAVGNFDGVAGDEVALVRNSDGRIVVMKLVGGALQQIASYSGFGAASQFVGIASANVDGVGPDELAVVRNFDGGVFVMRVSGSTLVDVASSLNYGANSQWVGIVGGNFDGVAGDELALVRNFDARFVILKKQGSAMTEIATNTQAGANSNWLGITAGDFDGDGVDEVMADRDFDGNLYTYKMVGGVLKAGPNEYFPNGWQHGCLGAGKVRPNSQARADLVMIRNSDWDAVIYDVVPGSLTF